MDTDHLPRPSQSPIAQDHGRMWPSRVLIAFFVGLALVMLTTLNAPLELQNGALGIVLCLLAALLVATVAAHSAQIRRSETLLAQVRLPLALASDHVLFQEHEKFTSALLAIANNRNPVFRDLATFRISSICDEIAELAEGRTEFCSTETWRSVYQQVLGGLKVKAYYSVAWVKSIDYWNDPPGRQGMQWNFELAERGYRIERVVILPDSLWPFDEKLPVPEIRHWLDQQHQRGLVLSLVREHELASETDLICDLGIYGDQAMGFQELDEHSRTVRYRLDFSPLARKKAHDRWQRLQLYAKPYGDLVDGI